MNTKKWILSCAIVLFIGCSDDNKQTSVTKTTTTSETITQSKLGNNAAVVRVYFATDRNLTESKKPAEMFGTNRAPLSYGTCYVSIPRDHRMGELEAPSIWRLEFREDPSKHVILFDAIVQTKDKFFSDVSIHIHASRGRNAFLFVHGYNVTFEDAARRTAQISYDLGFDGAPVFYSWPSQGATAAYPVDEQNIEWTEANLKGFLDDFFKRSDVQNVFLIAHSMGNRALTRAVASLLAEKPSIRKRLKEVILTAPDIDADVFRRDIAPALAASSRPITLYASSEDLALVASKKVHGYPRAGDSGQGLVVVPGVETIDATGTDTSLLGHSYFAEARSVLSDIFYLVRNSERADQRSGLRGIDTPSGRYWVFNKQTLTTLETKMQPNPDYASITPGYLDQNWDHETRMDWWYTSQGSRLLPYDWFLALERPNSEELVSSKANLEQYRFVAWPADSKWNPNGLPIGFVADKDAASGTRYLGFTCAACHTGKVAYKGNEYLVEGAPAHHDFDRFLGEIADSMQKTTDNGDKFSRFSARVLGASAKPEDVAALKAMLALETNKQGLRTKMNRPPHPNGYGRLDAFGSIFNEVVVTAIDEQANAKPADAPVSYPMLWDTPQHDVVQWNGSAVNAGIGPYSRNTGEVVGVFGDLNIEKAGAGNPPEMSFKNHINIEHLGRLEEILTTLWSPLWPDKLLPAIDQTKAQAGKQIFETNCIGCHQGIKRDDPMRKIEAKMIPVTEIGTDPTMAMNIVTRTSKTGILEGQPVLPLNQLVPNLDKLAAQALSVQLVRYGVVGILRDGLDPVKLKEGLPAFLEAAKKNTFKDNCDPKQEGMKCLRPPAYKARPLNGIWASAPYLHNGSVPNLWELLQKPDQRVTTFNVGSWDIDPVKVGFATDAGPATSEFNTMLPGNSNKGHAYGSKLSDKEKWELIEYLKTL